jgi:hypothetical protein
LLKNKIRGQVKISRPALLDNNLNMLIMLLGNGWLTVFLGQPLISEQNMKDLGIFWEEPSLFVTGFLASLRAAGRAVIKVSGLEKRAVRILLPYRTIASESLSAFR